MVECYTAARIESKLGLRQGDLIMLAMLLGCDYTVGIHGVGIVNGLEIIRAFTPGDGVVDGSEGTSDDAYLAGFQQLRAWAQNVADWGEASAGVLSDDQKAVADFKRAHRNFRTQWAFPEDFPNQQVHAAFTHPVVDRSREPFSWAPVDAAAIVAKLADSAELGEEKVLERLQPALQRYNDGLRQPRITEYMVPVDAGNVAVVCSTRMQNALRGLRGEQSPARSPSPLPKRRRQPSAGSRGEAVADAKAGRKKRKPAAKAAAAKAEGASTTCSRRHGWQLRPCEVRINLDLDD